MAANTESEQDPREVPLELWVKALLRKPANVIITFNQYLDQLLAGGIHLGQLTELFGEKGVGKTTLCLQLCITTRLPRRIQGLGAEAIFIETENSFIGTRLKQMAQACAHHCRLIRGFDSIVTEDYLLNGIHCVSCNDLQELEVLVLDLDDYIQRHPKVKLVVLDSLAFPFHTDVVTVTSSSWVNRNKYLYRLTQEFNQLINKYGIAVILTNNMTTRFSKDGDKSTIPCLGPSWPYMPQVRLELQRDGSGRKAVLLKSFTCVPQENVAYFTITSAGIR